MIGHYIEILFLLMFGHALADFSLQTNFLAEGKNRNTELGKTMWIYCLPGHALIHGGMVVIFTGSTLLGIAEMLCHGVIDFGKCEKWYGMKADQIMHIGCKMMWAAMAVAYL